MHFYSFDIFYYIFHILKFFYNKKKQFSSYIFPKKYTGNIYVALKNKHFFMISLQRKKKNRIFSVFQNFYLNLVPIECSITTLLNEVFENRKNFA